MTLRGGASGCWRLWRVKTRLLIASEAASIKVDEPKWNSPQIREREAAAVVPTCSSSIKLELEIAILPVCLVAIALDVIPFHFASEYDNSGNILLPHDPATQCIRNEMRLARHD